MWQNVLEETFGQYRRLSTDLLGPSEDITTALNLWRDYVAQVESFTAEPVPTECQLLAEQQRLCHVHKKILHNHHQHLQNRMTATGSSSSPHLEELAVQHDRVIQGIADREDQIASRLKDWEEYRQCQDDVFAWIRRMEREKLKLDLRHVRIDRVPTVINKIEVRILLS